jgi:hypothetical protein
LPAERFPADAGDRLPVLLANRLDEAAIEASRAKATGDYLVSSIPILDH